MKRSGSPYYIFLALIAVIGCFYYSYNSLIPKYKQHKADSDLVQAEIKAIDNKITSLQNSKQTLLNLGDIVDKMLVAIPNDKDSANLITEIEALSIKHNVYIPSIQISDPDSTGLDTGQSNKISVAFSASGSFSDTQQFIQSIEHDLRFMTIKNITISASGNDVSLSIQIETYKRTNTSLSSNNIVPTLSASNTNNSTEVVQ